eukprot:GHVL01041390.1.p1 GENE.GHVL01041390.1~~GHVL01041390.1.p1  ORF type:complete len:186 (-),score=26.04 GHVL01041390.1:109-666(-)
MSDVEVGSLVWVPNECGLWDQSNVNRVEEEFAVVGPSGSERRLHLQDIQKANPTDLLVKDNTQLLFLNAPSLLFNIKKRFFNAKNAKEDILQCQIYTFTGWTLTAVNPYCQLQIYTNKWIDRMKCKDILSSEPHPFAIANKAFNMMISEKLSQSIIVSGESGAGKTEASKVGIIIYFYIILYYLF